MFVFLGSSMVVAAISWQLELPIAASMVIELEQMVLVLACVALFVERRLVWAAAVFAIAVPIALWQPADVLLVNGAAALIGFSLLAAVSRQPATATDEPD
jgi:hypothetical protein